MEFRESVDAILDRIAEHGEIVEVHVDNELADGPPNNGWATKAYTGRHTLTVTWQDAPPRRIVDIASNLEGKVKLT